MKKRVALLATSVLIAALLLVGVVYAADVLIDDFDTTFQYHCTPFNAVFCTAGSYGSDSASGALGGTRDISVTLISGSSLTFLSANGTTANELEFSAPSGVNAVGEVVWDGDSDATTLDKDGLGGLDLTDGGTNESIVVSVLYDDRQIDLTVEVYSNTNSALATVSLPGDLDEDPNRMDVVLPFTSFSGDTSVFSSAGAVRLRFSGASSAVDVNIDQIVATTLREYGDLPTDTYEARTLDAYHIPGTLRLGNNVDVESVPNDSSDTTGDDTDDFDDEDGITPTNNWSGGTGTIVAHVEGCPSAGCYINGWIDWNGNGYFTDTVDGASEHIFSETETSDCTPNYTFDVPSTFGNGCYYARFRICDGASTNCDDPGVDDTAVSNGEIEDYYWCWGPTAITLTDMTAHSNTLTIALGAVALAAVGLMGAVVILRRRRA
jgi:hypothetical protein